MKRLSLYAALIAASLLVLAEPSFAQLNAAGAGAAAKVNTTLNTVLYIVTSVALALFTIAISFAGYKFAFVEGTKLADLKGLLIGGSLFGAAGALAAFFIS